MPIDINFVKAISNGSQNPYQESKILSSNLETLEVVDEVEPNDGEDVNVDEDVELDDDQDDEDDEELEELEELEEEM
jgi:hypothetical protein